MNILIIYDSVYGNTEKIARAMGDALGKNSKKDIETLRASDVKPERAASWAGEIVKAAGQ